MGDLIEFTTWPQHQHIFYKITCGAIEFSVKGEQHAAIGLARKPGPSCEFWIVLGHGHCWLERLSSRISNGGGNILSNDVYDKFWISWHNSVLKFGRKTDKDPLLTKDLPSLLNIQYVTFSAYANRGTQQWKLYIPPKLAKPVLKKVKEGDVKWIKADDKLPDEALIGGYQKEILYIIRAPHRGSLTPGKFVPSQGLAFISWGGEMHDKNDFEVLCGYNCIWVSTSGNKIPVGAVEAGFSEGTHETLYIGRAIEENNLIPGKVQPSHQVCYIPYNEKEIAKKEYEILVNPQNTTHSSNRFFIPNMDYAADDGSESDEYDWADGENGSESDQ